MTAKEIPKLEELAVFPRDLDKAEEIFRNIAPGTHLVVVSQEPTIARDGEETKVAHATFSSYHHKPADRYDAPCRSEVHGQNGSSPERHYLGKKPTSIYAIKVEQPALTPSR
jgi:hypothetical protein